MNPATGAPTPMATTSTPAPDNSFTLRSATVPNVQLQFVSVTELSRAEIQSFNEITEEWFENYYAEREGRRVLQQTIPVRNMVTKIETTSQNYVPVGSNDIAEDYTNTITYQQTLLYDASDAAFDPETYVVLPFLNNAANTACGNALKADIDAFQSVKLPIASPENLTTVVEPVPEESSGISVGVLIGALAGGVFLIAVAVGVFLVRKKKNSPANGQDPAIRTNDIVALPVHDAYVPGEPSTNVPQEEVVVSAVAVAENLSPQEPHELEYKDQVRRHQRSIASDAPGENKEQEAQIQNQDNLLVPQVAFKDQARTHINSPDALAPLPRSRAPNDVQSFSSGRRRADPPADPPEYCEL